MGDVEASMATVPGRTGDGRPVRLPVAMPASGFGVVGRTVAHPVLSPLCGCSFGGCGLGRLLGVGALHGRLWGVGILYGRLPGVGHPWLSWGGGC